MFAKIRSFFSSTDSTTASSDMISVKAPLSGTILALEEISDPVFAQKMLGDGLAIDPESSQVLAPFAGEVAALFPTGHAVGLKAASGLECLIHIGIDTVSLNGAGFTLLVAEGDTVQAGQPLIDLDLERLRQSGKSLVTPVIITSSAAWQLSDLWEGTTIHAGIDTLYNAVKKEEA